MIHVIRQEDAISKVRDDGTFARYYLGRDIEIIRTVMPAGCASAWHTHGVVTEVIHVLTGRVDAEHDSDFCEVLSDGDLCAFPPGVRHRLINRGKEPAFVIAVKFIADGEDHTRDFQTDKTPGGREFEPEPWRKFFSRRGPA